MRLIRSAFATMGHMVKRSRASRSKRAEPMPTRTLGIPTGRTSGDANDRLLCIAATFRQLRGEVRDLSTQVADLLAQARRLPLKAPDHR